jgi:predicted dehydrogenase
MHTNQSKLSRRQFVINTGKLSAGLLAVGALSSCRQESKVVWMPGRRAVGANERINLGIIGVRSRGWALAEEFMNMPNVHIHSLCDVDGNVLDKRVDEIEKKKGYRPKAFGDMRKLFEEKDIDAVVMGTPNHWHALGTIWACQAGKHVYVEKPTCHNVWEGRKMVEASRKYNVLVQAGFQNRSIANVRRAMEFLREGGIGEVYMARGLCYKPREWIGNVKDGIGTGPDYEYYAFNRRAENYTADYMAKVDYDYWTGPAKLLPFNYNRFHYNWHWNWNYGGGDIHNQGPHQFDVARWGLGKQEHPVEVSSSGGLYGPPGNQETPNVQTANIKYADGKLLVFEVRGLPANKEEGIDVGNLFYGTKGWMSVNGGTWKTYFGYKNEPGPSSEGGDEKADPMNVAGAGSGGHQGNFIAAIRSGKREDQTCDIAEGNMSSALPILANISYRLGRTLTFDGTKEQFVGDRQANALLKREGRGQFRIPERV